jgi:molecular chaperone GrpE
MTTDDAPSGDGNPDAIDAELAELIDSESSATELVDAPAEPTPLETATADRDQFKDMALRIQADFENYRKRSAGLQADEVDRSTGKVVESLLPVLDACEAAFSHGADGVEPIWSALLGVLQKQGLEVLDLADQPFDPALADAVSHEPGDGESTNGEPVVAEVLRTGYRWKNRVIRAAMVRVKG